MAEQLLRLRPFTEASQCRGVEVQEARLPPQHRFEHGTHLQALPEAIEPVQGRGHNQRALGIGCGLHIHAAGQPEHPGVIAPFVQLAQSW